MTACGVFVRHTPDSLPRACENDAICKVTYFLDGSGSLAACGVHRDAAIKTVASESTVPTGATLKYTPLGTAQDQIERFRARRNALNGT